MNNKEINELYEIVYDLKKYSNEIENIKYALNKAPTEFIKSRENFSRKEFNNAYQRFNEFIDKYIKNGEN